MEGLIPVPLPLCGFTCLPKRPPSIPDTTMTQNCLISTTWKRKRLNLDTKANTIHNSFYSRNIGTVTSRSLQKRLLALSRKLKKTILFLLISRLKHWQTHGVMRVIAQPSHPHTSPPAPPDFRLSCPVCIPHFVSRNSTIRYLAHISQPLGLILSHSNPSLEWCCGLSFVLPNQTSFDKKIGNPTPLGLLVERTWIFRHVI
jgi:hypothetical protein